MAPGKSSDESLVTAFFRGEESRSPPDFEERLDHLCRAASAALPSVWNDDRAFVQFLGERLAAEELADESVLERVADLWLVCACCRGDEGAAGEVFRRCAAPVRSALLRVVPAGEVEDAAARMWELMLVGAETKGPRIAQYKGRGSLRAFLCTAAARLGISTGRKKRPSAAAEDEIAQLVDESDDPEVRHLKDLYRHEFRASFERALAGLTASQRLLLRLDAVDRLTIDETAAVYGRSRSTTGRHLVQARHTLARQTLADLKARLRLDESAVQSLAKLVRSQLHLSIERLLET